MNIRHISTSMVALMAADMGEGSTTSASAVTAGANKPLAILTDEAKVKAIKEAMADREIFPNLAAAMTKLTEAATKTTAKNPDGSAIEGAEPFFGLPVAVNGTKEGGEIDESVYEGKRAALAFVGAKLDKATGIKGIVIFPVPTVDDFLASENGKSFVDRVVVKECALVGFRSFRDSATLYEFESGVNSAPASVEEYASESRRGIDTDTFDTIWPGFRSSLKDKLPALHALLPTKKEFLDSLRSKAYALSNDNTKPLEEGGWFVKLGNLMVNTAAKWTDDKGNATPLETDTIKAWLAGRDSLTLDRDAPKPKDFSVLGSLNLDFAGDVPAADATV